MYGQDVVIYVQSMRGSGSVEFDSEGSILFASHLRIDGEDVYTDGEVQISISGSEGFVDLTLHQPSDEQQRKWAEMNRKGNLVARKLSGPFYLKDGEMRPLHERFALADQAWGSTKERIVLGVRSIQFVERPVGLTPEYDPVRLRKALRDSERGGVSIPEPIVDADPGDEDD